MLESRESTEQLDWPLAIDSCPSFDRTAKSAQGFSPWPLSCKVKVAPHRGTVKSSVISPRHRESGRVLEIPDTLACLWLVVMSIYLNASSDGELTTSLANHSLAR